MSSWISGRTVLVTGGSSGIGYETARALAKMGAQVVLASRNLERTQAAAQRISAETGDPVQAFGVDMSSQASVREFAAAFIKEVGQLDVLLNNAGAMLARRRESVDGIEMTLALNHLGPFLLTSLLLPLLQASEKGRVVNVASSAHSSGRPDWDDLQYKQRGYKSFQVYGQSKLFNIMFTKALARRLEGTGVTANCLHPGLVASGFFNVVPVIGAVVRFLARPFLISNAEGAKTSIYLVSDEKVGDVSGEYFDKCAPKMPNELARDGDAQEQLWQQSIALTGAEYKL